MEGQEVPAHEWHPWFCCSVLVYFLCRGN
jgi:hypothetical protein